EPDNARESAHKVLEMGIDAYKKRDPKKVDIPNIKHDTLVGFCPEGILSILGKLDADDPLKPLIQKISSGDIYGIVLFAGCNNYKVVQDSSFIAIAEKLSADNVLLVATGCAAGAFAKRGFLSPQATSEICGDKLRGVLEGLGDAAGLGRPLPPVWHMGSCVDNSRVARLAFAIANRLGVDVDKLPVVASAPEAMSEKSVAIGTWAVAMGLTTHLGVVPPILGGKVVAKVLTETAKDLLGASFIVETNPFSAYQRIKETLTEKRIGLGLG
ncbi:MAG: carbon monoxide dehydrogenase, partial [Deltaproteobacteria bacterium]|nr:carbon monoxide dehydrogenase [Deltaproteobacteria bacterium]